MSTRHDQDQAIARPSGGGRLVDRLRDGPLPRLAWRTQLAMLRFIRPVTLGARMMILDGDRLCLVRHGYRPGWFLPGGGVDRDETLEQAAIREAREEAAVAVETVDRFVGIYANLSREKSDHVAVFLAGRWSPIADAKGSMEIAEVGFFPLDRLPEATTDATRRRIAEVLHGAPQSTHW